MIFLSSVIPIFISIMRLGKLHRTNFSKSVFCRSFSSIWITNRTDISNEPSVCKSFRIPQPDVGKLISTDDDRFPINNEEKKNTHTYFSIFFSFWIAKHNDKWTLWSSWNSSINLVFRFFYSCAEVLTVLTQPMVIGHWVIHDDTGNCMMLTFWTTFFGEIFGKNNATKRIAEV